MSSRVLDWRDRTTSAQRAKACKLAGAGRVVMRPAEDVVAAMLHQTGCWYGVAPYQLRAAKGDEELARHTRALGIHAHATAMRHGKAILAHDPLAYVHHGDVANPWSWSLEHEGLYDADGRPLKAPNGIDIGEIIEGGRAALSWAAERLPHLRLVWAHRQSRRPGRAAKTADPGAVIFREVGIEHGVRKLGLTIEPERVFGAGRPLPPSWYAEL